MFLRFSQDTNTRTIDLNSVTQIQKTRFWGNTVHDAFMIRVDMIGNYVIVADHLTSEQADEIEDKLLEAWTQRRDQVGILEIAQ